MLFKADPILQTGYNLIVHSHTYKKYVPTVGVVIIQLIFIDIYTLATRYQAASFAAKGLTYG